MAEAPGPTWGPSPLLGGDGRVGCGIAMGNASDEVKKYAHQVTETVHNDGVAFGIEKFVV